MVHYFIFEKLQLSHAVFMVKFSFGGWGVEVALRFGRLKDRSVAVQITWLLALSSSGPAYTVCKTANKSLYKMLYFSHYPLQPEEHACSLSRPACQAQAGEPLS